jgi:hypothetical protein
VIEADSYASSSAILREARAVIYRRGTSGQALGYLYFDNEPQRSFCDPRAGPQRGEAHARNFAELPEPLERWCRIVMLITFRVASPG